MLIYAGILVYRLFSLLSRLLPARPLLYSARRLGRFVGGWQRRELRIATAQLLFAFGKRCPASSRKKRQSSSTPPELALDVFGHIGEAAMELLYLDRLEKDGCPITVTGRGQEHVEAILSRNQGAVALSGHLGCIELLAAFHVTQGVPLSVIGRRPNYPAVAQLLDRIRAAYGVQTLWRNDAGSIKKLLKALREGRFIAALIDQDTSLDNGFAPFFGLEAASPITPIKLAIQHKLPLLSSFIVRLDTCRHEVITEPLPYDADNPTAALEVLTVFNERLEALIRQYPEQWVWWHRRWRRRPNIDYSRTSQPLPSTNAYLHWLDDERREKERSEQSAAEPPRS